MTSSDRLATSPPNGKDSYRPNVLTASIYAHLSDTASRMPVGS